METEEIIMFIGAAVSILAGVGLLLGSISAIAVVHDTNDKIKKLLKEQKVKTGKAKRPSKKG